MLEHIKQPRSQELPSKTKRIEVGCGKLYVTVAYNDDKPFEVFCTLGKAGACACANIEAITRCISISLRFGMPIDEYINQLNGIRCPSPSYDGHYDGQILSCADGLSKVLKSMIKVDENK
jgi:ribonucleoside-diphosphate reductase alpha chain